VLSMGSLDDPRGNLRHVATHGAASFYLRPPFGP
jgi:hypothetical protein